MGMFMSGNLGALEALMREAPNTNHYDNGCDGRYPECRSCRYHLPLSKRRDCFFDICPYLPDNLQAAGKGGGNHGSVPG